jgi:hypothetical protein
MIARVSMGRPVGPRDRLARRSYQARGKEEYSETAKLQVLRGAAYRGDAGVRAQHRTPKRV